MKTIDISKVALVLAAALVTVVVWLLTSGCANVVECRREPDEEPPTYEAFDSASVPSDDDALAEIACDVGDALVEPTCWVNGGARLIAEGFDPSDETRFLCIGRADDVAGAVHAHGVCEREPGDQ